MKITDSRATDILRWLDDETGNHALLFEKMTLHRDAAALIRQLQAADGTKESLLREAAVLVRELDAAEQAVWHAGLDAGREQRRGKDHAHQPPSAPVGVDELVKSWEKAALVDVLTEGERAVLRNCTRALRALAQQPAAVDGGASYPTPRNRQEATALAKLALAYLGVTSAHIDAAVARCETDLAAHPAAVGSAEAGIPITPLPQPPAAQPRA